MIVPICDCSLYFKNRCFYKSWLIEVSCYCIDYFKVFDVLLYCWIYLRIREIMLIKNIYFLIEDWVKSFIDYFNGRSWDDDCSIDCFDKEDTIYCNIILWVFVFFRLLCSIIRFCSKLFIISAWVLRLINKWNLQYLWIFIELLIIASRSRSRYW